jgi:sulfite exporter TauE/SafE
MTALVISVFLASLLGSLHCAGMCGAFVAIACGRSSGPSAREATVLQSAYHGGRLVTYLTLGLIAGTAGQLLDLAGSLAGLQPVAAALAGATMIAFALVTLMRLGGVSLAKLSPPAVMARLLGRAHRHAMSRPPVVRAGLIGLCTTLLPCGWLYAFVITAAGTASAWGGALVMAVFWLGTLPMLVAIGAGTRRLLGAVGEFVPALTCLLLVGVGLYTITGRTLLDPRAMAATLSSPATTQPATQPAVPAPGSKLPCCPPEEEPRP